MSETDIFIIFQVIYVLLCVFAAFIAGRRGHSRLAFLGLALFLTPLISIIVAITTKPDTPTSKYLPKVIFPEENRNVPVFEKCEDTFIRFSCPQCGKRFKVSHQTAGKKGRCTCGMHVQIPESKLDIPTTVTVSFMGTALPFFGRVLLAILSEILIIPAPWVKASLHCWIVEHLSLSDGTYMTFSGKGSDIWPVFMCSAFLGWLGLLPIPGMNALVFLLQLVLWLAIVRWIVRHISIIYCTDLSFTGKDGQLLGWSILLALSLFTIIGWAWVMKGLARWYCKNVAGVGHSVEYIGTGWGILWRTVITAIGCILLIPTPWVTHWLFSWHVNNIRITRKMITEK